ncbi:hypothetical protein [Peptacetobacter hiranonis]|uniref:Uncharacterized protein n=1 Tax=Peptacetobacter hiranonis (strain DSM 13275 / JCM 10541 / KCTC 15199 / TO-931) TaxID=500633 RepID=B6G1Y3_PEPHT|nr:hypothetical protein [Peptacetobacter hiranonis]EEA84228.1 hypothetical protein CLOHIR_02145 [Peptacetobacter hiranonis DSM 13275]QEK19778.1 hypothetical protein KGNDJEFE_00224 [Peptacetobacter hiranonis]
MKERRKIDLFGAITMLVISMAAFYLKNSVGAEMIGLPLESFVYIGIGIFILGLIYTIMETKMQLPYFYGRSQSGGSNANSFVVMGIGAGLIGSSIASAVVITLVLIAVAVSIRMFMDKRYKEKNEIE